MGKSETQNSIWIRYVQLHDYHYKSIRNVDFELKPGLNILIGKNGAGKTNLLRALRGILVQDTEMLKEGLELYLVSKEGDCPKLFESLRVEVLRKRCRYFAKFLAEFSKRLVSF